MSNRDTEIANSIPVLQKGGTLVYPTNTVWGLGCDGTNAQAVDNIYKIKNRPREKGLILLVDSVELLTQYVQEIPPKARELIHSTQHPLTIIYPNAQQLPENVTAPDNSIAIRVTRHPFCRQLIEQFVKPLVSTSANVSGSPTPSQFTDITEEILSKVDYVVNLPLENVSERPSTIVKILPDNTLKYIRK